VYIDSYSDVDFDGSVGEFQSFWAVPSATLGISEDLSFVALGCFPLDPLISGVLYEEPLITGNDQNSILRNLGGDVVFGWYANSFFSIYDDFKVSAPSVVNSMKFYAVPFSFSNVSPAITSANLYLFQGSPGSSQVIFSSGNVGVTTTFTGVYRVLESDPGGTQYPIMEIEIILPEVPLAPDETYWFQVSFGGSSDDTFIPPIAAEAAATCNGNGRQSNAAGSLDSSSEVSDNGARKGFPFQVIGLGQPPVDSPALCAPSTSVEGALDTPVVGGTFTGQSAP